MPGVLDRIPRTALEAHDAMGHGGFAVSLLPLGRSTHLDRRGEGPDEYIELRYRDYPIVTYRADGAIAVSFTRPWSRAAIERVRRVLPLDWTMRVQTRAVYADRDGRRATGRRLRAPAAVYRGVCAYGMGDGFTFQPNGNVSVGGYTLITWEQLEDEVARRNRVEIPPRTEVRRSSWRAVRRNRPSHFIPTITQARPDDPPMPWSWETEATAVAPPRNTVARLAGLRVGDTVTIDMSTIMVPDLPDDADRRDTHGSEVTA